MSRLISFRIEGLYGYKTIGIECADKAAIVLAENGVGKTTLLTTLYALLSGAISKLVALDFHEAILDFEDRRIVFTKSAAFKPPSSIDVRQAFTKRATRELFEYATSPEQLMELVTAYAQGGQKRVRSLPLFRKIYASSPFDEEDIFIRLDRLRTIMYDTAYIADFRKRVVEAMEGVKVLYLPTYRRIEADFEDVSLSRSAPQRRPPSEEGETEKDELIYFGLSDVEEKLDKMTKFIQQSMFESYSRLSGRLIDTLLDDSQAELPLDQIIDLDAVRLILGRLGKASTITEYNLERAIRGTMINDERSRVLAYFLRELVRSYEKSRQQETAIEEFVRVVNGYLESGENPEKRLTYDKILLKVEVWHEALYKALPFRSLSSGEKQIVSMFARLFLDLRERYLILIDEPELSLSIEWQRRFLPDILAAKSCNQLVAITHSPFVFENELDPLARSIFVNYAGRVHE